MASPKQEALFAANLVGQTAKLLALASVHALDHPSVGEAVKAYLALLEDPPEEPSLLQNVAGVLFVNGARVKLADSSLEAGVALQRHLDMLGVAEMVLERTTTAEDVLEFLAIFQAQRRAKGTGTPAQSKGKGIQMRAARAPIQNSTPREILLEMYSRLVVLLAAEARSTEPVRIHRFRRPLQRMVDVLKGQEADLLGLVQFRTGDHDPRGFHGVAVAACALVMGRKLGLTRVEQSELALAALFHDIGRPLANAADEPHTVELRMQRTALLTAQRLIAPPITPPALERAFAAFESTLNLAQTKALPAATLLGRLLAVPSAFDILIHPSNPAAGMAPDQAMRTLMRNAGTRFDLRVVKLFSAVMGVYPVGSVVRLSNGRSGVVLDVPSDFKLAHKPRVRLIAASELERDAILDLADEDNTVTITGTLEPHEVAINATQLLFA